MTRTVVDEAERAHVVILGGDVWLHASGSTEPAYANWGVERVGIKPDDDDVARAAEEARRYISAYPTRRKSSSRSSLGR